MSNSNPRDARYTATWRRGTLAEAQMRLPPEALFFGKQIQKHHRP